MIAGLDEEALVSALEAAVQVGVLEESASGRPGGMIRYRFAHAFFRQTLYEELSAPRRLRIHQEVARALELQYAARLEEHAAELAEHFAQSTDRDDLAKAVRYGELAAQRALAVYAYGEAARHLEQALDVQEVLDPDDKAKRCDLLLALGEALVSLGEGTRAVETVAPEALRLAESLSDRRRASHACRIVQRAFGGATGLLTSSEGLRWAELADRYAEDGTVDRVYADVFASVARRDAEAFNLMRRASRLALALGDAPAIVYSSLVLLSGQSHPPGAQGERLALAEEVSGRALEGAGSGYLAQTLNFLGQTFVSWGRREEAERHWQHAKEIAANSRDATMALVPPEIDALRATLDGELDRALALGTEVRLRGQQAGREAQGKQVGARAARRALIYLGRGGEALGDILERADPFFGGGIFAGQKAACLALVGRSDEAADILHRMMAARDMSRDEDETWAAVLRYLLEAAVVLRDVAASRVLAARMAPMAGLLFTEADMCYNIGRLCGGAAALLGEAEKARGYYEQAIEICEKVRFRPEIALTRLEMAELLLGTGPGARAGAINRAPMQAERAEAMEHLDFAIAEFRGMKMQPSLERALRHKDVLRA